MISLNKSMLPAMRQLQHLAIIMDGNSRWAEANGLPRNEGHRRGAKNVRTIAEACADWEIKYLSLFAFSTENWQRPRDEVNFLMKLMSETLQNELSELDKRETRVQCIGDLTRFPQRIQDQLEDSIRRTAHHSKFVLTFALNYGGQWDLARAARSIAEQVKLGLLNPSDVDESTFESNLSTYPLPAPDLCIRTGGDHRISNFTLWDLAYTELYFSDRFWPEFSVQDLNMAFKEFKGRKRRFGARPKVVSV